MVVLKNAQFADYTAIAKLHAESWRQNYRGILGDFYLDNEVMQDRNSIWFNRLKFPTSNQQVTVAVLNNEIAGFSCLMIDDDPVFGSLLDNLHVSSQLQKSGIGKLLMKECAKNVHEKAGIKKIYLWAYELNKNAGKMYEHMGGACFEIVETTTVDEMKAKACRYIWNDIAVLTG